MELSEYLTKKQNPPVNFVNTQLGHTTNTTD